MSVDQHISPAVGGASDDADLLLASQYLSNELSERELDAFEWRLVTDAPFRAKVEPMINAWFLTEMGLPRREAVPPTVEQEARAYERFRRAVNDADGGRALETETRAAVFGRTLAVVLRVPRRVWLAITLATMILFGYVLPLAGITALAMFDGGVRETATQRVAGWFQSTVVRAPESDSLVVVIGKDSRAVLGPGASLRYRADTDGDALVASVVGRATITVAGAPVGPRDLTLWTKAGSFQLMAPGRYVVRTYGTDSSIVEVEAGAASARGRRDKAAVDGRRGDEVIVPRDRPATQRTP